MAQIKDIVIHILKNYPHKDELSNARVTKLVYLADWRHVLETKEQISSIKWYFDNYGPFVWAIKDAVENNPDIFEIKKTKNSYGEKKDLFKLKKHNCEYSLSDQEIESIDFVIDVTKDLNWSEFIRLVYSTYPVASSERYTNLNLKEYALTYDRH